MKRKRDYLSRMEIQEILDCSSVLIVNNCNSVVYYRNEKNDFEFELDTENTEEVVSLIDLKAMSRQEREAFFGYAWIYISDIFFPKSLREQAIELNITEEDVWEYLGISKYYDDYIPKTEYYRELLLNIDATELQAKADKIPQLDKQKLIETAIAMFVKDNTVFNSQMLFTLECIAGREGLFSDITSSQKYNK